MGQQALVDTGVVYGAFHRRDQYHETGLAIVRDADEGALPQLIVLDFVLAETMNALTRQLAPDESREALSMLEASAGFDVVRTSATVWARGRTTYSRLDHLSFVDALLVAFARERGRAYLYSFDTGFDGVDGVQRLNTNVDPYGR